MARSRGTKTISITKPFFKPVLLSAAIAALSTSVLANNEEQEGEHEEIIITATKLPRSVQDIAGTVSVISDTQIEQQQVNDLNEVVKYLPGVSMNRATRGGNQGFIIRGIGGNRVLTLLDGVRANNVYSAGPSSYGSDMFETDNFQSVEIIRGPASVLYGADAMGGAVLIKSKAPSDYLISDANTFLKLRGATTSDNEQNKLGFTTGWAGESFEGLVQFTQRDFSEREVNGDGELNPQDGEVKDLLLKTIWNANDSHRLTFTFDITEEEVLTDLNGNGDPILNEGLDESERQRFSFNHLWEIDSALVDSLETQIHWQGSDALQHTEEERTSFSFAFPSPAIRVTDFEFNQKQQGLDLTALKSFNTGSIQHTSVYGIQWTKTDTERPRHRTETSLTTQATTSEIAAFPGAPTENFPNKTFPDTVTERTGIFWQNEMVIGDSGYTLIPGIRYDQYEMKASVDGLLDVSAFGFDIVDVEDSEVSLSVGLIYDLNESLALFAQYAEGFRPPNYDEANQAFVNLGFGYATVPNPELDAETSRGIELGLKAQLASGEVELAIYDNHYKDFINSQFLRDEGGISLFQNQNIGEVRIRGADISSRFYLADNWRLTAGLAYSKGDDDVNDVPLDSVEPLTTVLSAGYFSGNDTWGIESFLTWAGEQDRVSDPGNITGDSYAVVDLTAFYNFNDNFSVRAGVFNVFDEEYAQWSNISGLSATSAAVARAFEPGTNYRLTINYRL